MTDEDLWSRVNNFDWVKATQPDRMKLVLHMMDALKDKPMNFMSNGTENSYKEGEHYVVTDDIWTNVNKQNWTKIPDFMKQVIIHNLWRAAAGLAVI